MTIKSYFLSRSNIQVMIENSIVGSVKELREIEVLFVRGNISIIEEKVK